MTTSCLLTVFFGLTHGAVWAKLVCRKRPRTLPTYPRDAKSLYITTARTYTVFNISLIRRTLTSRVRIPPVQLKHAARGAELACKQKLRRLRPGCH
ncbi:hypothetical protein BaRGS_00018165 [Batillaria attramentaria]|uniref:Secreted protein n=1 Tax=Batillaria attramentaria TaxID=370345 RepID=A0ABD0KTK8_9CAEN